MNHFYHSNNKDFILLHGDCMQLIGQLQDNSIDAIFADPPYAIEGLDTIPDKIFDKELLNPQGYLILEHPGTYNFENHKYFVKERKYGNVHFSFFELK